ncbi:MAG: class I SAM-dependent methyltransferase [Candidatus Binatia bacterium]
MGGAERRVTVATQTLDETKVTAFAQRMTDTLNDAFLAFMVSIGHQTSLFDTMAQLPPATSEEIARAAELQERYVREWLGAMVTGRIVEYEPARKTYVLPREHAACLTRAAGGNNLATSMLWVSCIGAVEPEVVQCFHRGGGVPYAAYTRFHEIMQRWSGQILDETLIEKTLPLVPGLIERLQRGIDVLDVGCGSGHAINLMGRAFSSSRFTGYDFSEEGLAAARAEASAWGLTNVDFVAQDVAAMAHRECFDFITAFDAIHDQAQPRKVLAGIARALRPGRTFLMVDDRASSYLHENLDHPLGPFLYGVSTMHCMTVSLAQGGEGLGTVWGEQKARELLAEAGFVEVAVHTLPGDIANNYYVAYRG